MATTDTHKVFPLTFQGYKTVRYCRGEKRKTKTEVSSTAENLQRDKTASE